MNKSEQSILFFKDIGIKDVSMVGGKNGSLGEMFSNLSAQGVSVPNGFALTTKAYWYFLKENKIDQALKDIFQKFDQKDMKSIQATGKAAREVFLKAKFPEDLKKKILEAYQLLGKEYGQANLDVAVRSSGVCEDMPKTSFAGQFESYLNISGKENLLKAIRECFSSTFSDRAISYRQENKIPHLKFALSVVIQKMIRSDLASSGVMFTLDTESGFKDVVLINSIFGLGEMIVKGKITPDEFNVFKTTLKEGFKPIIVRNLGRKAEKYIYKSGGGIKEVAVSEKDQARFSLEEEDVLTLAKWACKIQDYYKTPQDIEWAKDGKTGKLFIIQSRPETVHTAKVNNFYEEYLIKTSKKPILTGIAVGSKIGQGRVKEIHDVSKIGDFRKGEILVTKMTDPDWVPAIRMASAIITDEGGRTCHAAIVSRELGIPAIVGARRATALLRTGQTISVDCTSGATGRVFLGNVDFKIKKYDLNKVPDLKTKIMVNIGAPDIAFKTSFLPNSGVGLARMEFILAEKIKIHPLALLQYKKVKQKQKVTEEIEKITAGYKDKREYFIDKLAEGISQIGSAFYPKPVIVRFSDFKTNEYSSLLGGEIFEPKESNPMMGWRGASRYYDERFEKAFEMECQAMKKAREIFGLKNIWPMIPFCRTIEEGKKVLSLMAKNGLVRGKDGLKVIVMCEVPSNVILAEQFLDIFDGMSIGSNDLTQLTLGLDRDNGQLAKIGDERNEAVKHMIKKVIKICRERKKYCGICGQAPSDYPEFAEFLIKEGIESMSLNPDTVIKTIMNLSKIKI